MTLFFNRDEEKTQMNLQTKLKHYLLLLVALVTLAACGAIAIPTQADSCSTTNYQEQKLHLVAKSVLAIDARTGQVLYAKNANQPLAIASMTKLVTVYLTLKAIKNHQLSWQTKIKPTKAITKVADNSEYSNVPLKQGHQYTVRQLYQATLIESANGAAMCLAQKVGGSQTAFVRKMRQQVRKWGIKDAQLYTVNGLPNGNLGKDAYPGADKKAENKMSAKDMALVSQHLLHRFPYVVKTTKIAHLAFKDQGRTTQMTNFDLMLKGLSQYDSNLKIDGLKTGTTNEAGACFIGTMKHSHTRLITVVMGARHRNNSDPARFIQTKKLFHWIFSHYNPVVLKKKMLLKNATAVQVKDGQETTTNVGIQHAATVWDPIDQHPVTANLTRKTVNAPLQKGKTVTAYQFKSGQDKLISLKQAKRMQLSAEALQNNSKVNFFVRLWRFITGRQ